MVGAVLVTVEENTVSNIFQTFHPARNTILWENDTFCVKILNNITKNGTAVGTDNFCIWYKKVLQHFRFRVHHMDQQLCKERACSASAHVLASSVLADLKRSLAFSHEKWGSEGAQHRGVRGDSALWLLQYAQSEALQTRLSFAGPGTAFLPPWARVNFRLVGRQPPTPDSA